MFPQLRRILHQVQLFVQTFPHLAGQPEMIHQESQQFVPAILLFLQ